MPELDPGAPIDYFLPLELRSPRGGGGGGSGGGGGGSSGGGGGGGRGGASSSSSSKSGGGSSSTSTSSSGSGSGTKSGSSGSSSKSGGSTVVIYNTGYGPYGSLLIPVWAIVLLVIIAIMILVFLSALVYYYGKEKKTGQKTRHGHVWWKAFTIPTLLFIPIKLYKHYQKRKADGSLTSTLLNAPAYTKIEPDHYAAPATTANASASYGDGGTGYNGALAPGKYDHHRLSTTTLGSTSTTPEPLPYVAAPPPYTSAPPPLPGQAPAPAPLGLGADYYAQHPLNTGSPQPSPGPAAVTFPTTATRPPVILDAAAPVHNPYSMSATYMPEGRPP